MLFRPGDRPWFHALLLGLTLATTFATYFLVWDGAVSGDLSARVARAAMFSLSLMAILGAHEMGHYVYARRHRVDASLPYFIPMPLLGLGTLGALIRIRSRIPHRNALVDIGASGPIAGLLVTIPVLALGLAHARIVALPTALHATFPGESSLWSLGALVWDLVRAKLGMGPWPAPPPAASGVLFGDNLLILAVQRAVLGALPAGSTPEAHPMVLAGWFGTLVTMLNLVPIGQLDGGHLTFALFGARARSIGKAMAALLFGLCLFVSAGWVLWLIIASRLIGFGHPETLDSDSPLSRRRKWICALCLVALLACVMPLPISQVRLP
jgi:membrane-associated protease RseP (regulator of RpoE activity)